ncbi:hypothetical protein ACLOJK_022025 [Asimina triloba]
MQKSETCYFGVAGLGVGKRPIGMLRIEEEGWLRAARGFGAGSSVVQGPCVSVSTRIERKIATPLLESVASPSHTQMAHPAGNPSTESEDDEMSMQWAEIERLPTIQRPKLSLLSNEEGKKRAVYVRKFGAVERQELVERLIHHVETDNRRLLQKIKERIDRIQARATQIILSSLRKHIDHGSTVELQFCESHGIRPIPISQLDVHVPYRLQLDQRSRSSDASSLDEQTPTPPFEPSPAPLSTKMPPESLEASPSPLQGLPSRGQSPHISEPGGKEPCIPLIDQIRKDTVSPTSPLFVKLHNRLIDFPRIRSHVYRGHVESIEKLRYFKLKRNMDSVIKHKLVETDTSGRWSLKVSPHSGANNSTPSGISVNIKFPTVEVKYKNLWVEAECQVVDGKPLPTLWNSIKSVSSVSKPFCLPKPYRGAATGEIAYNGCALSQFVLQKTSAYISQHDLHIPEMAVRETLDFSARRQGVGCRSEIMVEVIRQEKKEGIVPELDIDTYMKAISVEGLERTIQTDYILKILGLDICSDTIVGDAMRRGISGGQKKRLTIGEMTVGPTRALFMDEISNGLDSSTTFQIISCLQQFVHITEATALISLLQPAPEIYDMFDDIILIAEGKIVYHGPRGDVLTYFEECGFQCPKRKGVTDFLQEVISKKDQAQYWYHTDKPYNYVSVEELAKRFKGSLIGKKLEDELSNPYGITQHHESRIVLPFVPLTMAFQDVQYYVDIPPELKRQVFGNRKLQLLQDITGVFRPGVLTALMGVSGAGKTTLMDVLSGRKTGGTIEGDIRIGGYPKVQETFARISGYCEQTDIHSPQVTIEESVIFSAWLRLPSEIDSNTKAGFVAEVLEMIELDGIKDNLVGIPGVSGLSTEQRKRLTIAVELVANPSIIFMDEPTSGLDARAAAIVMRAVKNVGDSGRTVVCTIHQPSIDIFESFDELLLMKKGGKLIYAGPLGQNSSKVIEYFEFSHDSHPHWQGIPGVPKIKDNYNPATWVLEVTSTSTEAQLSLDFAHLYSESALYNDNQQDLLNMLGAMFSAMFFVGINNCSLILPFIGTERTVLSRERFAGMYSSWAYSFAQVAIEIPYVFVQALVLVVITDPAIGYFWSAYKFLWYFYAIFCTLLYFTYLGMLIMALSPNIQVASILASSSYTMFNLFSGFLIPGPKLIEIATVLLLQQFPRWWHWCYWISPTSWSLRGLFTSQYGDINKQITAFGESKAASSFIKDYLGYDQSLLGIVAIVLAVLPFAFHV